VRIATLLADAAERVPGRPALASGGTRISYAELDAAADCAAGALRAEGVGRGDRVALVLPNRPSFVAAYHGALRLGAVAVPINPLASEREVAARVADTGACVVVTEELVGPAIDRPEASAEDETAVVLYTSGTSGEPKRVELTHAGLRANAEYLAREALEIREDDVLFGAAPLAHVFGMTCCMNATLVAGACLALVERFDPEAALGTIEDEGVTAFMGVPAMCVALLAASDAAGRAPQMRLAHVGGAPLALDTLRAFEERFGATVLEGYGMTEVGGTVATSHAGRPRKPGSVGTPAAGGRIRIDGGDVGEVLVESPTVMRGHEGPLATGDVGYLDEDGYLFLVERKKDVILRGGYNVYAREVEEVLFEHPHVREGVVVGVPDERLGEEVVALVVPGDDTIDPEEVKAFVRERVAAYKYPRHVLVVDDLPRSASGKVLRREIDREALRERL
jgi:long-chain acyl-CoA synthetase